MDSHETYLELCAASTAGELSSEEEKKLEEHLWVCASCRRAKHEYEATIQHAVPALSEDLTTRPEESATFWSIERAEADLFKRLEPEQGSRPFPTSAETKANAEFGGRRFAYRPSEIPWAQLWMPFAACVLLAIALGIVVYRSGVERGADSAQQNATTPNLSIASLEEQISDLGHEKAQLLARLADGDRVLTDFKRQTSQQTDEINRLKGLSNSAVARERSRESSASDRAAEVSRLAAELLAAQANLQTLEAKADALGREREDAARRSETLELRVDELSQRVRDRDQAMGRQQGEIARQQELLDHDRDIRELMGARDLYIAEVHDVAGNGETDKTYGRIFYTKGKSLIFYAFDLDQEAGVKDTSTFQAWGQRGANKQQALNLGVFYEDNASKKRWVLKFDDPNTLATIDAVFVTAEPNGGSHHPSGKHLLFADLRITPNHP